MSYSFGITATSPADAKAQLAARINDTIQNQPPHTRELPAVLVMGCAFIDALAWEPGKVVNITCSGSVSCANWSDPQTKLQYANVSFTTSV